MSKLNEFRDMIDKITDLETAEAGKALLRDLMEINSLRERETELKSNLLNDGKAIFYFFAEELNEDEIVFAAERMSGKIKRLERTHEDRGDS